MDKQIQAVAEAIKKAERTAAKIGASEEVEYKMAAEAAIEASGAEHLGELVQTLKWYADEEYNGYNANGGAARAMLEKLPPELRGK